MVAGAMVYFLELLYPYISDWLPNEETTFGDLAWVFIAIGYKLAVYGPAFGSNWWVVKLRHDLQAPDESEGWGCALVVLVLIAGIAAQLFFGGEFESKASAHLPEG
jgi:hypothetical protein